MPVTQQIKGQLMKSADSNALQHVATKAGMRTLRDEGAELAKEGLTTSSEVIRVTRQTELYT